MAKSLLVTGKAGTPHVTSYQFSSMIADIIGKGRYLTGALNKLAISVIDANTIQVATGALINQGRYILNEATAELKIANGTQDQNRRDLVCLRYSLDEDTGIEAVDFEVIQGTPTAGTPATPGYVVGNLFNGDPVDEVPLAYIPITGISVGAPVLMTAGMQTLADFGNVPILVSKGGTGATTAAGARSNLDVYSKAESKLESWPVDSIYMALSSVSPAARFGGSWTQLTGRFPYFGNDLSVGGSSTHNHTTAIKYRSYYSGLSCADHYLIFGDNGPAVNEGHLAGQQANNGAAVGTKSVTGTAYRATIPSSVSSNLPPYQTVFAWRRVA